MVAPEDALPGRDERMVVPARHEVLGAPLEPPFPAGLETAVFGLGCFWGAERVFWQAPGVYTTAVGYAGGYTPNPTYEEACSGRTGHTEAVLVVFDPAQISYDELLRLFWENHDPTQGMRQGNDVGTQYRSAIYTDGPEQLAAAEASRDAFQRELARASGYCEDPLRRAFVVVGLDEASVAGAPLRIVIERGAEGALVERDARRLESCVDAGAAPGPVQRVEDEAGLHGVEREVAVGVQQLLVGGDRLGEAVGAEQVGAAPMDAVVPARVSGVEALEGQGDTRVGCTD